MGELKAAKIDYRSIMCKAKMAALAINKSHASKEDQALSFQDYIVKHPTPDKQSLQSVQEHFEQFSHIDMKEQGVKPLVTVPQVLESSFRTQHFGEPVPDEYRV